MVISWKPPLDSGGVDVSNYIIEKRDTNRDTWTTVTSATTKTICKVVQRPWYMFSGFRNPVLGQDLKCYCVFFFSQIPKLTEGREYIMRISAENMYGISDPLDSEEMKAKDLFSMLFSHSARTHLLWGG